MKKQILYYTFAIALVVGVNAGANRVSAQIAGGYSDISASSKEVKRAVRFAVQQRMLRTGNKVTLVKIVKAERQVVAGLNYRIVLGVADRRGRRRTATVVVYQDLKDHLSLTSWKTGDFSKNYKYATEPGG